MNSRERIKKALSHRQPDKLPVDFGATLATGIHVSIIYKLRQHYALDSPGEPVKVIEPYQMLGEIKDDLRKVIGVDCTSLQGKGTFFGFNNENWKEWELNDGTPVLVPGLFNTERNKDGSIYQYPQGDKACSPSGKMPDRGFYFDAVIRQKEVKEEELDPSDNLEEYGPISEAELGYLRERAEYLHGNTDFALVGMLADSSFGDIAFVPGLKLKYPRGIRDVEEWYISTSIRREYVKKVFEGQMDIALENLKKINDSLGIFIDVAFVSGTDFGMQQGCFISVDSYRELFKPFHSKINSWIHENTGWKTFIHSCGGVYELIPEFIDAGFDIMNPVQISASGMEPERLKKEFGPDIVFWGGGIDTQKTLPMGAPDDVKKQARKLIEVFNRDGGFVFNTIHNIQANTPLENVTTLIDVIHEYRE